MESGHILIDRVNGKVEYPADFMLVAAMNPCKCGYYPDRNRCSCTPAQVRAYFGRLSRPLLDRIDVCVQVPRIKYEDMVYDGKDLYTNEYMRSTVERVFNIQKERFADIPTDGEIDGSLIINFQEMLGEDYDGQMRMVVPEKSALEAQITGQMSIQDILEEWEKTKRAAEKALQEAEQQKLESAKAKALAEAGDIMERLADVIPQLDAGLTSKEPPAQEY